MFLLNSQLSSREFFIFERSDSETAFILGLCVLCPVLLLESVENTQIFPLQAPFGCYIDMYTK